MPATDYARTALRRLSDLAPSGVPDPAQLSREFRLSHDDDLSRRRKVIGLCLIASAAMGVVALYQTGLTRRLPEPRLPGLDSEKVNASEEAYAKLAMPDSLIGLASYAITAMLAAAGGVGRARRMPWLTVALGAKALADAGQAGKLTWDQWAKHRAFCIYCLVAAAATFATVPLALKDAWQGVRHLRS